MDQIQDQDKKKKEKSVYLKKMCIAWVHTKNQL